METTMAKLYEGMFLVDPALAASDWDGVKESIKSILEKFGAEIVSMKKWDERRLAYPVKGKTRGTYILVFFRVEGPQIADIERSVRLNDNITRVLILAVENPDEGYIHKQVPAEMEKPSHGKAVESGQTPFIDESAPQEDVVSDSPEQTNEAVSSEDFKEDTEEKTEA